VKAAPRLVFCLGAALAPGCEREPAAASPTPAPPAAAATAALDVAARRPDYLRARTRAHAWLDALEVDALDLLAHRVKGIKKVAEILDCYLGLLEHTQNAAEAEAIRRRVAAIALQTGRPEYHDLGRLDEAQFTQNSMSYLRVAWLLEKLGVDTRAYREHIAQAKPRFDDHIRARGPWQQAMFLEYYERFGLERPAGLAAAPMKAGVIARRVPAAAYDDNATYDLTHEVFVAYDYGGQKTQTRFGAADLAYTREVLPQLIRRYIASRNADLLGELLSCMTYLGWHSDPAYTEAVSFLLAAQNASGTWGDYEKHRPTWGKYLDQHVYLHTTMVVLSSLIEVFDGGWQARELPPAPR
jgi:hypothetical protein